jgi:pre-mRNA 3'-end-processing factor FIP1
MDIDEEDDFYAPDETEVQATAETSEPSAAPANAATEIKNEQQADELEEGEEEDEGGAMDEDDDDDDSVLYPPGFLLLPPFTYAHLQDIEIVTERKDGTKAAPPSYVPWNIRTRCPVLYPSLTCPRRQSRYSDIRNIPQRSTANDTAVKPAPVKKEESRKRSASGAELPAVATSKIDINAVPIHKGTGKPITQVNIDEGLSRAQSCRRVAGNVY